MFSNPVPGNAEHESLLGCLGRLDANDVPNNRKIQERSVVKVMGQVNMRVGRGFNMI